MQVKSLGNIVVTLIVFPIALFSRSPEEPWRVNGARLNAHIQKLHSIAKQTSPDSSRVAFSESDLAGRKYVIQLMRAAGLTTRIDYAGNIIGRREGSEGDLPPIMLGSHIDSVPHGGRYDGPVGVMAAVEVAHTLFENKHRTRHPLEIIIFIN
ncbi:MAG: M28 family peptidase, partial [bacterium]